MSHKPRKKRLTPELVKIKLASEEARRLHEMEQYDMKVKRDKELTTLLFPMLDKLHSGVQAAADVNPLYRPLVGENWYETLNLFGAYLKTLTGSNRSELLPTALRDVGMLDVEGLTSVLRLAKIACEEQT